MNEVIETLIDGLVGYYGRGTPLTWDDACAIEGARTAAMRQAGYGNSFF